MISHKPETSQRVGFTQGREDCLEKIKSAASEKYYETVGEKFFKEIIKHGKIKISDLAKCGVLYINSPKNGALVKLSAWKLGNGEVKLKDILLDTGAKEEITRQIAETKLQTAHEGRK